MSQTNGQELMAVSYFITNPDALAALRRRWAERDRAHKVVLSGNHVQEISSDDFGGSVNLIDPFNLEKGFLAEISSHVAMGMYFSQEKDSLFVGSGKMINQIQGGKIVKISGNNLFNDIHSLSPSSAGNILVVSTGIDGVLEVNPDNMSEIKWDWLATENGYSTNMVGEQRIIDRTFDYQAIETATPEHTTHINSCFEVEPGKILATLFHQGEVILIDKHTKESQVMLNGLKNPHFIRKTKLGFIVSDTLNNRALLLSENFQIEKIIEGNLNWLQDAIELSNGEYLLADSNNNRIIRVNIEGELLDELRLEKDSRKVFCFLPLTHIESNSVFGLSIGEI